MYDWTELIERWEHERMTPEQVIGQLLKYGEQSHKNEAELRRRLETVEQTVAMLVARDQTTQAPPAQRPSQAK